MEDVNQVITEENQFKNRDEPILVNFLKPSDYQDFEEKNIFLI